MTIISQTVIAGVPYSRVITAPNGLFYATVDLPNGLTLGQNGVISGIPIQPGRFTITVLVRGTGGTGAAVLDLTVTTPPTPFITSVDTRTHEMGTAFSYQITASSPTAILSYNATNLPTGLTVNTSTGLISGTPTSASNNPVETTTVTLSATNAAGTGSQNLILTLQQRPVITSSLTPLTFTRNIPISPYTITASKSPLSFGATPLPSGLNLNTEAGIISGTPILPGGVSASATFLNFAALSEVQYYYGYTSSPTGDMYVNGTVGLVAPIYRIYKVTSLGQVTLFYSFPSSSYQVSSLAADSLGNVYASYVLSGSTYGIAKIASNGTATFITDFTTAGTGLTPPGAMACDASNNLYFLNSTQGNNTLVKRTPSGDYFSFTGTTQTFVAGVSPSNLGAGAVTTAGQAGGIFGKLAIGPSGDIYVAVNRFGASKGSILRISPNGTWRAIGIPQRNTYLETSIGFTDIWVDSNERVYYSQYTGLYALTADVGSSNGCYTNKLLYQGNPNGVTSPWWGPIVHGDSSGNIYSLGLSSSTSRWYIAKYALAAQNSSTTTVAGSAGASGSQNGTGAAARFNRPQGLALSPSGDLYIADTDNGAIRKMTPSGVVTTVATGLVTPQFLAYAPSGNIYVSETSQNRIKKIEPNGNVSIYASVTTPNGLAVGADETLYVAQYLSGGFASIIPPGTVVSSGGQPALNVTPISLAYDGVGLWFLSPNALNGIQNYWIYRARNEPQSTLVLSEKTAPFYANQDYDSNYLCEDGALSSSPPVSQPANAVNDVRANIGFSNHFCVGPDGLVYLTNSFHNSISVADVLGTRRLKVFAGALGATGSANGVGNAASFNFPTGIAAGIGFAYVADTNNHTIRKIEFDILPTATNSLLTANNGVLTGNATLSITVTD